ncbi:MAG: PIN domain-containing protein [Nitrospirota bacterium]
MNGNVLVDTSVWINYFQKANRDLSEKLENLLSDSQIFVPKIVIAGLIQGAHSEKEIAVIANFLDAFKIVDQKEDTWLKAGKLSFGIRKKGKSVNLIDCYIAVIAKEHRCSIYTLDRHFNDISKELGIKLL